MADPNQGAHFSIFGKAIAGLVAVDTGPTYKADSSFSSWSLLYHSDCPYWCMHASFFSKNSAWVELLRHTVSPSLFHNLQLAFSAAKSRQPSSNGLNPLLGTDRNTEGQGGGTVKAKTGVGTTE